LGGEGREKGKEKTLDSTIHRTHSTLFVSTMAGTDTVRGWNDNSSE
jgi:hypothetical protein